MVISCKSCTCERNPLVSVAARFRDTQLNVVKKSHSLFLSLYYPTTKRQSLFKLNNNVDHIYTNFINEGKLSVSFRSPCRDVCLCGLDHRIAQKLANFISCLHKGIELPNVESIFQKSDHSLSKLVINNRANYPLGKPFPTGLIEIEILNVGLRSFDDRIISLTSLRYLNISDNILSQIPTEIQCLNLKSLRLSNNKIHEWPSMDPNCRLASSLRCLNLSNNSIKWLPEDFWIFKDLNSFNISHNKLCGLPAALLHTQVNLHDLDLTGNQLSCLPCGMSRLRNLVHVSLSENPWHPLICDVGTLNQAKSVSSLLHLASATAGNYYHGRFSFFSNLDGYIPHALLLRLSVLRICCVCDTICGFDSFRLLRRFAIPCIERVCDHNCSPNLLGYCCSQTCLSKLRLFPQKYV